MRAPTRKTIRRSSILLVLVLAAAAATIPALMHSGSRAQAAPGVADAETIYLCASAGTLALPGPTSSVNIWGFSLDDPGTTTCDAPAVLPGPELSVDVGDEVTVTLRNNLTEDVSIVFPGQDGIVPNAVVVEPGTSDSYTFTASDPGTYLYEAGTNTAVQVAMGLYGALVVRPVGALPAPAYGAGTEYDVDEVLVLSEIDPNLNNYPGGPNGFDFVGDPELYTDGYHPTYFLINGKAYPDTVDISAANGQNVLLRYVNAGLSHHTMTLLGDHQRVIAKDAYPTGTNAYDAVAETIPAGSTLDTIVSAATGTYPLYSSNLDLTNGTSNLPGGMLTFLEVP